MYINYLIDTYTRKVDVLDTGKTATVQSNINVDGIKFYCKKLEDLDLSTCVKTVVYNAPDDLEKLHTFVISEYEYNEEEQLYQFYWNFDNNVTTSDGYVYFSLSFYTLDGEDIKTQWNTIKSGFRVFPTSDKYLVVPEFTQEEKATIMQQINSLFSKWDQVSDVWTDISSRFDKIEPAFYDLNALVKGGTAIAIDESENTVIVNDYSNADSYDSISEMLITEKDRALAAEKKIDDSMIEKASLVYIGTTDEQNDTLFIKTVIKNQEGE